MANIKRQTKEGYLVGYRPRPGYPEAYGICPTMRDFEDFQLVESRARHRGEEVPSPTSLYRPAAATGPRRVSLREWIGQPKKGRPGEYFTATPRTLTSDREAIYQVAVEGWVAPFEGLADKPMGHWSRQDVRRLVDRWLECAACRARAEDAGLDPGSLDLRVIRTPWDGPGACTVFDDEEDELVSSHFPAARRSTMAGYLSTLKTVFAVGASCDDPVCVSNPVDGVEIPRFAEPPSNEELSQALSFSQLGQLAAAMPELAEATISVGAFGVLRRSELLGLDRASVRWPGPDDAGVGQLSVNQVYVRERGVAGLRAWGKTLQSTRTVMLAAPAVAALRDHMARFRSTPNPALCETCAAGSGEWGGPGRNPHRRCDFADDAPMFVGAGGGRLHPDDWSDMVRDAAEACGLGEKALGWRVTGKILRATGGTLLLELGVPYEVVAGMGGWTNGDTLRRHYARVRDDARSAAARLLGQAAAAALGHELDEGAPIELRLQAAHERAERATAEVARLRDLLAVLGVDVAAPTMHRVAAPGQRTGPSRWEDRTLVADAVAGAVNQQEILKRLGVSLAGKNYRRLEQAASEFGLTLPGKHSLRRSA